MICSKCGLEKPDTGFIKLSGRMKARWCKACWNEHQKMLRDNRVKPHHNHGESRPKKPLTPAQERERIEDQKAYDIGAKILKC